MSRRNTQKPSWLFLIRWPKLRELESNRFIIERLLIAHSLIIFSDHLITLRSPCWLSPIAQFTILRISPWIRMDRSLLLLTKLYIHLVSEIMGNLYKKINKKKTYFQNNSCSNVSSKNYGCVQLNGNNALYS